MLYCVCVFSHMFVYLSPDWVSRSQCVCGCLCPAGSECCIVFVFSHTCLFICLQIGSAEASVYVDAFALQEVKQEDLSNFSFVAGCVPPILELIRQVGIYLHLECTLDLRT